MTIPIEQICSEMENRKFYGGEAYCVLGVEDCMYSLPIHEDATICLLRTRKDMLEIFKNTDPNIIFNHYKQPHERYTL